MCLCFHVGGSTELPVTLADDPHHGQPSSCEPLPPSSHGTNCAGGTPSAVASRRIVRSEANGRLSFSIRDTYVTDKPARSASNDCDHPRRRRAVRTNRPGEPADSSKADTGTRSPRAKATTVVSRADVRAPCSNLRMRSELSPQRSASCCWVSPTWRRSCATWAPIASSGVATSSPGSSTPCAERAQAPHTDCRLYRLSGTPHPAHNRGTTWVLTAAGVGDGPGSLGSGMWVMARLVVVTASAPSAAGHILDQQPTGDHGMCATM
jgi:hypothetical protein